MGNEQEELRLDRDGNEVPRIVKNLRLTPTLARELRIQSFKQERPEAEIVREALGQYFTRLRQAKAIARQLEE